MAVICARCGAQNPDGNAFCQTCGTPLTAQVPAGVGAPAPPAQPSWLPSPPAAPPQYAPQPQYAAPAPAANENPYYSPVGPTPPVHRTSWIMLVGPVLIGVVVLGGGAVAFASLHNQSSTPVVTAQDNTSNYSPPPGSTVVSNTSVQLTVPPGWSVVNKDAESITLTDSSNDGAVTVASGPQNPTQTAQQDMDAINQTLRQKYPDTRICPGRPVVSSVFNGAKGFYWTLCFTVTSGARSVPAVASLFAGANADGSVGYLVMAVTPEGNLTAFTTEDKDLLQSIHWKLT